MAKKMVSLQGGYATIVRNVVARGYHLRLKCYLKNNNFEGLTRQQLVRQFTLNVERILSGLQHPGYYRSEECVNSDGTYSLRLVPVTKSTMTRYIAEFTDTEEGVNDLESSLWLIEDQKARSDAMAVFIGLLSDMAAKEASEDATEE